MLEIWGRHSSFNVQKVMWLLDEFEIPYKHTYVGGKYGGLDEPKFLKMNPHGRIPVISDNGKVVWESHTILRYLAAKYTNTQFWPADAFLRSQADCWMDWAQTILQPDFLDGIFWGFYRTPESQRDWKSINKSIELCKKHFLLLDRILSDKEYLCGNNFSLADIPCGTVLYRYFELDIDHPSIPNVQSWYRRLQARKAYRTNVMIPFDEMKGKLTY